MSWRSACTVYALILISAGCSTVSNPSGLPSSDGSSTTWREKLAQSTAPLQQSWQRVTENKPVAEPPRWNWAPAVPVGATRSEIIPATIPLGMVAHFAPDLPQQEIRLVSTAELPAMMRIANVGGYEVRNCADLHTAVERAMKDRTMIQVDFASDGGNAGSQVTAVELDSTALMGVAHAVAQAQSVMRIGEDGNQRLVIREDGVRCKLTARVERSRGLLNVVVSLVNCWGEAKLLPVEVRATCDGQPLRCLSVSETLEALYGNPGEHWSPAGPESFSFAAISERDDYALPANYKRLHEETSELFRQSSGPTPQPALAVLPGEVYPGPAVLGDARALTGFLLQRQLYQPDDSERTGWIMFAGPSLADGRVVEFDIDLGGGLRRFRWDVPST